MAILTNGARGTGVADLQRRLQGLGFSPGPVDGVYGPQTRAAVRAYQSSRGLSADGIYGPQTEGALAGEGAASGGEVAQPATQAVTPLNPENDPQYLAFLRAQGYSEADLRAQVALQKSTIQRNLANELPVIQENQRQAVEAIGKDYLGRGFWGGGEQQRDTAYTNANFGQQILAKRGTAADQTAGLDTELARKLAQGQQSLAEEQLAARKRIALNTTAAGGGY